MAENGKKKAKRTPGPVIPDTEFCTKWEAANSLDEARAALGPACAARAKRMRDLGVPLKSLGGGRNKTDVAALAKLIGRDPLPPAPKKPKKAKATDAAATSA